MVKPSLFFYKNMKITAYKCPDTGKIFESKLDYDRHRKIYIAKKRQERNHQKILDEMTNKLAKFRETAQTTHDIECWIIENSEFLAHRHNVVNHRKKTKFYFTDVKINVKYNNSVSNTHSAPFNGVENWGRDKNLPMGYPGWRGQVDFKFDGDIDGFFSDLFSRTGIHLGTGGGSGSFYSSDIILYEADWLGLHDKRIFEFLSQ